MQIENEKNKQDPQADKRKQGSGMNSPKSTEHDKSHDKTKDHVQGDSHKSTQQGSGASQSDLIERNPRDNDGNGDIDRQRHSEEQLTN